MGGRGKLFEELLFVFGGLAALVRNDALGGRQTYSLPRPPTGLGGHVELRFAFPPRQGDHRCQEGINPALEAVILGRRASQVNGRRNAINPTPDYARVGKTPEGDAEEGFTWREGPRAALRASRSRCESQWDRAGRISPSGTSGRSGPHRIPEPRRQRCSRFGLTSNTRAILAAYDEHSNSEPKGSRHRIVTPPAARPVPAPPHHPP